MNEWSLIEWKDIDRIGVHKPFAAPSEVSQTVEGQALALEVDEAGDIFGAGRLADLFHIQAPPTSLSRL